MLKKLYWFLFVYDLNGPEGSPLKQCEPVKKKLTRDLTILLLFSYTLVIFNTLIPVFADFLAHTFWEKEHLLTVHKDHGKYHVHFELVKAGKQMNKDKTSGNNKSHSENFTHLIYNIVYNFSNNHFPSRPYSSYKFSFPVSYHNSEYKPPRV